MEIECVSCTAGTSDFTSTSEPVTLHSFLKNLMSHYKAIIEFKRCNGHLADVTQHLYEVLNNNYGDVEVTDIEQIGITKDEALSQIRDLVYRSSKSVTAQDIKVDIVSILDNIV